MSPDAAWKGKKVLVTGGLGFIGSNLVAECVKNGAKVTVYDCLDPKSGGNEQNISAVRKDTEVILGDIRDFDTVSKAVTDKDVIFNCAAYTSHPNSMKEPLVDADINCKGTINLLDAVRRYNLDTKVVHIGTSTQTGKMIDSPITELHPEFPMDIYSASKSASEKYVLIYASAYRMRTTVVRLANNYGPRSCIKTADFGFINYFIGLALQGKELTIYGEGQQVRNVSYVGDSVNALLLAAVSPKSDGEVFYGVSDEHLTVSEIAHKITQHIGGRVRMIPWPKDRETIEIGDTVISNKKISDALGYRPSIRMDQGLEMTKAYYASCLKQYL